MKQHLLRPNLLTASPAPRQGSWKIRRALPPPAGELEDHTAGRIPEARATPLHRILWRDRDEHNTACLPPSSFSQGTRGSEKEISVSRRQDSPPCGVEGKMRPSKFVTPPGSWSFLHCRTKEEADVPSDWPGAPLPQGTSVCPLISTGQGPLLTVFPISVRRPLHEHLG